MTNQESHSDLINYGLDYPDPKVRELAKRFKTYRETVHKMLYPLEDGQSYHEDGPVTLLRVK